jgi:hypothetical protein
VSILELSIPAELIAEIEEALTCWTLRLNTDSAYEQVIPHPTYQTQTHVFHFYIVTTFEVVEATVWYAGVMTNRLPIKRFTVAPGDEVNITYNYQLTGRELT